MEKNTSSDSSYQKTLLIFGYVELVIGIVGLLGNIFIIIVFSSKSLRNYSYSFYCRMMAISDICLMIFPIIDWVGYNLGANLITVSRIFCKIVEFIPAYFGGFSINMLTMIAIDRMVTIVYPNRFMVMKKRWFQCLMIAIVIIIVLSTSIITALNYDLIELNQPNSSQSIRLCVISSPELNAIEIWIVLVYFMTLNIVINNILNIKTILYILTSRRRVNENVTNRHRSLSSRDRKFFICSICLNVASLVFKLPFFISILIVNYSNLSVEKISLIMKITGTLTYIDDGFSFFVNLLVNTLFYNEFLKLFGFRKSQSNDNRIQNNNSNNITNFRLKTNLGSAN